VTFSGHRDRVDVDHRATARSQAKPEMPSALSRGGQTAFVSRMTLARAGRTAGRAIFFSYRYTGACRRHVAEQRKRIAAKIKELQPKASNRQIAKALGVGKSTVHRDTVPNGTPPLQSAAQGNGAGVPNGPPSLSGQDAVRFDREADRWRCRNMVLQPPLTPYRYSRLRMDTMEAV
jgi:hypothetical protein